MKSHISMALVGCALMAAFTGVAVADHKHNSSPTSSPTASASATPTPSPTPVCLEADLAAYGTCVAACDAASSAVCSGNGSVDHYVSFLKTSLANCTYPNLSSEKQVNGLKEVVGGLKQSGEINSLEARTLRKQINTCRKALPKRHGHGHGHGHD